jgi:small subunit ribosomal protein S16
MVIIRLSRSGAKKNPYYRIRVADSRNANSGSFIDSLGFFNPLARGKEEKIRIDLPLLDKWLKNGAQITPRVKTIIKQYKSQQVATPVAS